MSHRLASALVAAGLALGAPSAASARQAAPAAAPAARPVAPGDSLAFDPLVRRGTLANGMRYYVRKNARPEQRAELRLVVNTGSVLEDDDQKGLAHFLEHMAFNGTRHFPKSTLVSYLEGIGTRFGPHLNAMTSFDETIYMLHVPTDSARTFARAFEVLEDWAVGQLLDSAEVEKERGVVIEEWRSRQGAGMRMLAQQLPVMLKGAKYAERLPIGGPEALQTFRQPALRRFYERWYRPDNMAVVAVGDFDPAQVERTIRERFGKIPAPASPVARPVTAVPGHAETLVTIATDREATSSSVGVMWKQPLRPDGTVGDYRRELVEALYNGMLNGRFGEIAQKPDAPFLGAGSGSGSFVRSVEVYQLNAGVKEGGIVKGLEGLLTEAERVARHGFVASELAREKADLLRALEQAHAEREKSSSASYAAAYADAFLSGEVIPGIEAEFRLAQQLVPGITLEEVNAVAKAWLTAPNRVIVASAPEKAGLAAPTEAELRAVFERTKGAQVAAWVDNATTGALLEKAPAAGRVVARKQHPTAGVTEWTLSNGARVLVKTTDFKADEVRMQAISAGGTSLAADDRVIPATLSTALVQSMGIGRFSPPDLQKALSGKAVQAGPFVNELWEGMGAAASPRDLEAMLQLVHLYFTAPRRDSSAYAATMQRLEAFVKNRGAAPQAVFEDTMAATLSQYHRRDPLLTPAVLGQLDLDQSLAFYRDRFADAGDFTFVFVGNVTPEQLEPLVATYLASLPTAKRRESWKDHRALPPAGKVEKVVRKGVEPKSQTRIIFHGPAQATPTERAALAALREVLTIRLRDALREDKGGTYGVGVTGGIAALPTPRYRVQVDFGAAPERLEELAAVVFQHVDSLKKVDVTAEELQTVRELQRRTRETSQKQNAWWLGRLTTQVQEGRPMDAWLADEQVQDAVTPAQVRAAAVKYLDTTRYIRGSLYPDPAKPASSDR